jgi:hypothetical protein
LDLSGHFTHGAQVSGDPNVQIITISPLTEKLRTEDGRETSLFFHLTPVVDKSTPRQLSIVLFLKDTMKISSTILAFALIQSANAFVQPRAFSPSTSGLSGFSYNGGAEELGVGTSSEPTSQGADAPLSYSGFGAMEKPKPAAPAARPVTVQGGSLRTWSFSTEMVRRVHVNLKTEGRPLNAEIDLWHGPDNTPQKVSVYVENGDLRPFDAIIETPGGQNAIAIRNTASMEYPLAANVEAGTQAGKSGAQELAESSDSRLIQGGSIKTYSFGSPVGSVQILLQTEGRPLNARIELLQGPNNNKQVIDLYTEDGRERPFYAIIETPGAGNVLRIINTATMEYPMTSCVEPYTVEPGYDESSAEGSWSQTNDASFFFLQG